MERCPNCGASIRTGARFCTACGFRLIQPAGSPTVVEPPVSEPTGVEPAGSDGSIPASDSQIATAGVSGSERVIWHGDPRPAGDEEDPTGETATDQLPADLSADATVEADSASEANLNARQDDIPDADATQPSESPEGSTETETTQQTATTAVDEASSSNDDVRPQPIDDSPGQDDATPTSDESDEPGATSDERPDIEQLDYEVPVAAQDVSSTSTHDDADSEPVSILWSDVTVQPVDRPSDMGTTDSAESGGDQDEPGPNETSQIEPGVTDEASLHSPEADGNTLPVEDDEHEAAPDSTAWQDDVVIDTAFRAETDQPGSYDQQSDWASPAGDIDTANAGPSDDSSIVAGPDDGDASDSDRSVTSTPSDAEAGNATGRDVDYEPWGAGGADEIESAADPAGLANGFPIDQVASLPAERSPTTAGSDGLAQARVLLEQLRATIDSLEPASAQPVADPRADTALGSIAGIGQIIDGLPSASIDPDRLADLIRLAEDLTDRDYDIRALQRFAQERETILSLATEVQQQRDVLDQIRSVLEQSNH